MSPSLSFSLSSSLLPISVAVRVNGIQDVSEDALVLLSHATQERMRDVVEKLTEISQHRMQALKVGMIFSISGGEIEATK